MSDIRDEIEKRGEESLRRKELARQKEIARRRDALEAADFDPYEKPKRQPALALPKDDVIRITIYIPRFLIKLILVNVFLLYVVFPVILFVVSGQADELHLLLPYLALIPLGMFLALVGWYLYWWILGVGLTCMTMFIVFGVLTGVVALTEMGRLIPVP